MQKADGLFGLLRKGDRDMSRTMKVRVQDARSSLDKIGVSVPLISRRVCGFGMAIEAKRRE